LPPELLELVRSVYEVVGPYLNTTLEQFEFSVMRDAHPEDEVTVWCTWKIGGKLGFLVF
jgi:hypothetical protein